MTDLDDLGDRGTTRGDGSPVKVIVKSHGAAVVGITVTATGTTAGAKAVSKATGSDGVASFTLAAGAYTVSASNDAGSATKNVTVVESTTAEIVALALAPKSA